MKTIKVITSWITFSSSSEKGPPCPLKPILFAGTCMQYSKKAIPQLIRMIAKSPIPANLFDSLNFKCPYHAKVIKMFESTSKPMV